MARETTAEDQVIDILVHTGTCDLEDVMHRCPTLTWNQVFLAVDHLSRCRDIMLVPKGRGTYTVTLPPQRDSWLDHHLLPS